MRLPLLALLALLSSTGAAIQETRPDTDNNTAIYPMCSAVVRPRREHLFRVGHGIEPPRVLVQVDPKYSELAKHMRLQGISLLNLVVDKEGFPLDICIQRSLFPDLDQKAARSVAQWRFSPATKNGEPVSVVINVEVKFRLY
jgi:TonB family protein